MAAIAATPSDYKAKLTKPQVFLWRMTLFLVLAGLLAIIVDGQTHGAIVQGVGQALWEQCAIDASGQPLCGSFMDYGMPRSDRLPSFVTKIIEVLSPTNPLGIKAGGEGGTTAAPAVIVSAIVDALAPYGIDDIKMPVTPYRIWQAIQGRKAAISC